MRRQMGWVIWAILLGGLLGASRASGQAGGLGEDPVKLRLAPPSDTHSCLRFGSLRMKSEDASFPRWIESEHFRVHFDTTGVNAFAGWPSTAYVDTVIQGLERAYVCFRDSLNLPPALSDGDRGGGHDQIDCTIMHLTDQIGGRAIGDSCLVGRPCGEICAGYIVLDHGLYPAWCRLTAAHEYFHLVQFAISPGQDSWFMESTATWSTRAVFPGTLGYAWALPEWFDTSYLPLWYLGGWRQYGSAHYWALLEETQGRSFIAELWRRCCQEEWLPALDAMLQARGSSFDQSLVDLALWCNATGPAADGHHYRDAAAYPKIKCQAEHRDFPVESASLPSDSLAAPAASNYIRFYGPGSRAMLEIRVHGAPGLSPWRRISIVSTRGKNQHTERTLFPDAGGDAIFTVPDWTTCDYVTLIVTNFREAQQNREFTYSAIELGQAVPCTVSLVCLPNPSRWTATIRLQVTGPPAPAAVTIFDLGGARVRYLPVGQHRQGELEVSWDGLDHAGRVAPYGCYFVRGTFGSAAATGKLLFLP